MPPHHESLSLVALLINANGRDLKEGINIEQWESIRVAMGSNTVSAVKKRVDRLQDEMKSKTASGGYTLDAGKSTPVKRAASCNSAAVSAKKGPRTPKKAGKKVEAEVEESGIEVEK